MRILAIASLAVLALGTAAATAQTDNTPTSATADSVTPTDNSSAAASSATPSDLQADSQPASQPGSPADAQVASNPRITVTPNPDAGTDDAGKPNAAITNGGELAH